jgi:hypothetical protein
MRIGNEIQMFCKPWFDNCIVLESLTMESGICIAMLLILEIGFFLFLFEFFVDLASLNANHFLLSQLNLSHDFSEILVHCASIDVDYSRLLYSNLAEPFIKSMCLCFHLVHHSSRSVFLPPCAPHCQTDREMPKLSLSPGIGHNDLDSDLLILSHG